MNCQGFESMLADALGDELDSPDRLAFDAHLAECANCRGEYESACAAIVQLRGLPIPEPIAVQRDGPRLVIGPARSSSSQARWFRPSLLRYAAAILLAFVGGYAYSAVARTTPPPPIVGEPQADPDHDHHGPTLRAVLADAHLRSPNRSDLAKCMSGLMVTSDRQ